VEPNEVAVIPSPIRLASLTALIGASGAFHLPTVGVFKNSIVLNQDTVLGDLTPSDFDGYSAVVGMTWDSPYIDADGSALVFGESITIVCTGDTTPNTCYGYYAADSGLTSLKAAWSFALPVGVASAGQAVSFVPALRFSGT
jgi:hypothetical protein